MFTHHPDQMSQGHRSLGSLFNVIICSKIKNCMNRINMEMIKVVTWAVVGFTACPKLNSKSISGRFFLCIKIQEVKAVMQ